MATGFQRLLLSALLGTALALSAGARADEGELEDIVGPDPDRRSISLRRLRGQNIEVGAYYGLLSVEDFGSSPATGLTVAHHLTEWLFFQINYATSTTRETSYEMLSGAVELLTDEQRDYSYYNLAVGFNLLPGQVYLGESWTFNTHLYLLGGAGNTRFADQDYFTYHLGAGYRIYFTDWLATDLGMRNHVFSHNLFGRDVRVNNLEMRLGLSLLF